MGGGKGGSSTTTTVSPAQERVLNAQADALSGTLLPAYKNTIGGAGDIYNKIAGGVSNAASNAENVSNATSALQGGVGASNLLTGSSGLSSLFGKDYQDKQVQAALQAGKEAARESYGQNNASYGAAGELGSSRAALAGLNLESLNQQRQDTAAAGAMAGVQANQANAANALMTQGQAGLGAANQAAGASVGYASAPQDAYAKYASIVFGTPQGNTTPSFSGTQSTSTSGKSSGFKL